MEAHVVDEALALAESAATVRDAARVLREHYSLLRVVVVDAFDMRGEAPAARGLKRQLYFGASDGHCWAVTGDAAQAAGLFIADCA